MEKKSFRLKRLDNNYSKSVSMVMESVFNHIEKIENSLEELEENFLENVSDVLLEEEEMKMNEQAMLFANEMCLNEIEARCRKVRILNRGLRNLRKSHEVAI